MQTRLIACNERGTRLGEDHQNAKLTNRDVEMLLLLREDGLGYRRLAKTFEISKAQVRRIIDGTQRAQLAVVYRTIVVREVPVNVNTPETVTA